MSKKCQWAIMGFFSEMEVKVCLGSFYRRVKLKIINIIENNEYNI